MRSRVRWMPLLFASVVLASCVGPCISVQGVASRIRDAGGNLRFSGDGASELIGRWGSCGVEFQGPQVGDDDLRSLQGDLESLSNLHVLIFRNTEVTDEGLSFLRGLTALRWVDFQGSKVRVTKQGALDLEKALGRARVFISVE